MVLVSVIIPTYNHGRFVLQTLESVFNQTFTDYEVIVVNDGSPDDTTEVLHPLVETGRIRYFEQSNAGQSSARNKGVAEAQGKYIALLDDDDLWPPDKLAWQVALLEQNSEAVLVYGSMLPVGVEDLGQTDTIPRPSGRVKTQYMQKCHITSLGQTLIRTEALHKVGGFDTMIWGADDWDLYIRIADQGTFLYERKTALYYRFHQNNASRNVNRMVANCRKVIRKHMGVLPNVHNYALWYTGHRGVSDYGLLLYVGLAKEAMQDEQWGLAVRFWLAALYYRPYNIRYGFYFRNLRFSIRRYLSQS